jgi:hypothetical protein
MVIVVFPRSIQVCVKIAEMYFLLSCIGLCAMRLSDACIVGARVRKLNAKSAKNSVRLAPPVV